jgi:putative flippase GtrA
MIGQAVRYGIVGAISLALYLSGTWFLAARHAIDRNAAIFIAFTLATAFNYLANYYWSFPNDRAHRQAFGRYMVLAATGLVWNELAVELLCLGGAPLMAAVAISAAMWALVSFVGLRAWVFGLSLPFRHNP